MNKSPRLGLLLAPLTTPVVFALWAAYVGEDPTGKETPSVIQWVLVLGGVTLFSYVASVLFGVPLIHALRRLNKLAIWTVVPAAALAGAVALVAAISITGGYFTDPVWGPLAQLAAAGALLGTCVAASYCWLAGIGRQVFAGRQ
jgi:hypothetical protein